MFIMCTLADCECVYRHTVYLSINGHWTSTKLTTNAYRMCVCCRLRSTLPCHLIYETCSYVQLYTRCNVGNHFELVYCSAYVYDTCSSYYLSSDRELKFFHIKCNYINFYNKIKLRGLK